MEPRTPRVPTARRAGGATRGLALAIALAVVAGLRPSVAGEPPARPSAPPDRLDVERRAAIRRACDWLASKQSASGEFGDERGLVAITALGSLALMAGGSGLHRGPHGLAVYRSTRALLDLVQHASKRSPHPGYFHRANDAHSRMHGHGFAMLAVASALGSADEALARDIREVLRLAVRCAEESQTPTGGWGYNPTRSQDHEGSVTVTIVQGLRAAHDNGIRVDRDVVANGLRYLRQSQKSDGSFKYSIQQDRSTYALTAAAVSSFQLLGKYAQDERDPDAKRIKDGIAFMKRTLEDAVLHRPEWYYYGHFYAGWSAWQRDGSDTATWPVGARRIDPDAPEFWAPWRATVYPDMLAKQRADGSWHDPDDRFNFGDLLPTAFATLTLAIPDELVPIFQR